MGLFSEPNAISLWKSAQRDRGVGAWEVGPMCSVGLLVVDTVILLAQIPGGIHFYKEQRALIKNSLHRSEI